MSGIGKRCLRVPEYRKTKSIDEVQQMWLYFKFYFKTVLEKTYNYFFSWFLYFHSLSGYKVAI